MTWQEDAEKYWDKVAENCINEGDDKVTFAINTEKVRVVSRWLFKNNFKDESVLEIGPGQGLYFALLAMAGSIKKYKGLDISAKFANQVHQMFGADVRAGCALDMPFEDGEFDTLFAFDVLEHTRPEDRPKVFSEINRVAKPKARMFINNPLTESFHNSKFDFGFEFNDFLQMFSITGFRFYHLKEFGIKDFKECPVELADRRYQMIELRRGNV